MPRRLNEMTHFKSIRSLIENNGKEFDDKTAVFFPTDGQDESYTSVTYRELYENFKYLTLSLCSLGFTKDTKVAVIGQNSYSLMLSLITLSGGAGIPAIINHRESPEIISHCVSLFSPEYAIADRGYEQYFPSCKKVIFTDEIIEMAESERKSNPAADLPETNVDSEKDTSLVIFTAGSTSLPKKIEYTNNKIYENVNVIRKEIILLNRNRFLSVMPLASYYELFFGLFLPLSRGAEIIYCKYDLCDRQNVLRSVVKELEPTIVVLSPAKVTGVYSLIWNGIVENNAVDAAKKYVEMVENTGTIRTGLKQRYQFSDGMPFGPKIKFLISSGDILTKRVYNGLRAFGIPVINIYGCAECPMIAVKNPFTSDEKKQILPEDTKFKIEHYKNEPCGKLFFSASRAVAAKNSEDGWIDAEDFATVDESDAIQIFGKTVNTLKIKGLERFLFTEQLERLIASAYGIMEAHVFPKKVGDDYVIAARIHPEDAITKNRGKEATEKHVIEAVKEINNRLLPFKRIRSLEISFAPLMRRAACKIKRDVISEDTEVTPTFEETDDFII